EEKGEINWSHGTYLPVADVEQAFGLRGIPRPAFGNVAPNQVFPHWWIYKAWALVAAFALLLFVIVLALNPGRQVLDQRYQVTVSNNPEQAKAILDEEHPFELRGWRNVHIKVEAKNLENAWVDIGGYLVNKETDQIQQFEIPLEYYQGVEDGEAWTEGSP